MEVEQEILKQVAGEITKVVAACEALYPDDEDKRVKVLLVFMDLCIGVAAATAIGFGETGLNYFNDRVKYNLKKAVKKHKGRKT